SSAHALKRDAVQPLPALDTRLVEGDALLHHGVPFFFRKRAPVTFIDVTKAGELLRLRISRGRGATPLRDRLPTTLERFFVNRPELKRGAVTKTGVLGHPFDGVSHVAGFQEADAAELLLRFSEGTIENDRRAVLPAQRLALSTRLQSGPIVQHVPILQKVFVVSEAVLEHCVLLAL